MNIAAATDLLSAEYRFAKTMPENPHWYTLRKTWADDAAFVRAVEYIREVGYIEVYKKSKYTMLNLNGFKYWTMGAPINKKDGSPCTILINRAAIDEPADYDLIADRYDGLFADAESAAENKEIAKKVQFVFPYERVLDIGCGTGLLLDYLQIDDYVGIDPSAKMLEKLVEAHKGKTVVNAKLEEFYDPEGFDLIVSLFGAMNYTDPAKLSHIYDLLRPGGRAFLMFYQERYLPVTYARAGVAFPHRWTSEFDFSGWKITEHRDTFLIADFTKRPSTPIYI